MPLGASHELRDQLPGTMRLLTRTALATLILASLTIAHGEDVSLDSTRATSIDMQATSSVSFPMIFVSQNAHSEGPTSYFSYDQDLSIILAHITLIILGRCFVLHTGQLFSSSSEY
jgi:hypothetical protein